MHLVWGENRGSLVGKCPRAFPWATPDRTGVDSGAVRWEEGPPVPGVLPGPIRLGQGGGDQSSSNLRFTSVSSSSTAWDASDPSAKTVRRLPGPAASIIRP